MFASIHFMAKTAVLKVSFLYVYFALFLVTVRNMNVSKKSSISPGIIYPEKTLIRCIYIPPSLVLIEKQI